MKRKVLVTGATGFIGNHIITNLLQNDQVVIATSRRSERALPLSWFSKVQYIQVDLDGYDPSIDYFSVFGRPDTIIHLAWSGLPDYRNMSHIEKNLAVHYRFIKNLVLNGAKDITITGTCLEYGMQEGCLSETTPTVPDTAYAVAKDALHKFLLQLVKSHSFVLKWVRLFYMYGKGQNPGSLLSQLEKAIQNNDLVFNMSGGEQVRDFLPVEKVAEYIVRIALQDKVTGTINCCSGEPVTVSELVDKYLQQGGKAIRLNKGFYPYPDYEPMRFWGDNSKLKLILDDK